MHSWPWLTVRINRCQPLARHIVVVYPDEELVSADAELQYVCGSQRPSEADQWIAAMAYMLDC